MSLKIRAISDVHSEMGAFDLPSIENEEDQILVLAGDIGIASKSWTFVPYLSEWSKRFQDVIYIMGNHEHYDGSIIRSIDKIKSELSYNEIHNVHVVEREIVRIDDVSFICLTLWSSFDNGNSMTMYDSSLWMNDFKKIRSGPPDAPYIRKITPFDIYREFVDSKNWLFSKVSEEQKNGQKVCVVTHHSPSFESVPECFRRGQWAKLNGAYASNLDYDILETEPNIWIHGHTHHSFDYTIGNTRILCNPRGYFGSSDLNDSFDPRIVLEI